ncbi:hypothetical protein [Pseudomonas aeruginosa]|uniref:hypothetical protein n=1 Tax=Pseudomonas aeruginosa TaxID=287 RepID=UPI0021182FC6|nr:hypothetical protein [Pseudomonas aeruginosa]
MREQDTTLALAGPSSLDRARLPCTARLLLPLPFVSQQPARSAWQVPQRLL